MSEKKTALVTGGSGGIGASICRELAREGFRVFVHYNSGERFALSLAEEIGGTAVKADLSDYGQSRDMFRQVGNVDVLVNNAGIALYGVFQSTTVEERREILDVNLHSAMNCCELALPHMIREHSGKIINISSIWGVMGASCEVVYSASKAAIIGFTKALAQELELSGITVNCVAPGVVDTKMNARFSKEELSEVGEILSPESVAEAVIGFVSGDNRDKTGRVLVLEDRQGYYV